MKKKVLASLAMGAIGVGLMAGNAMAVPYETSTATLTELQGVFNTLGATSLVASGAGTMETQDELFSFQTSGATATYLATVSWSDSYDLQFGLYDKNDTNNKLTLFDTNNGWPTPGDDAQIYIDYQSAGNAITAYTMAGGYHVIDTATFDTAQFGFYITSFDYNAGTYFSQSDLNDVDRFLTYPGQGDDVDIDYNPSTTGLPDDGHWYIAAESGSSNIGSDLDFTDFVVQVESMTPVPEPASMLLFGTGLASLAGLVTRRKKN